MATAAPLDKLIGAYIKIRDKKTQLTAQMEREIKALDTDLDAIKAALLNHCRDTGSSGGNAEGIGSFSRTTQTRYMASDWEAMHNFILDNRCPELLEKRVAQGAMKDFIAQNPDKQPPGLNIDSAYIITVRKSTK